MIPHHYMSQKSKVTFLIELPSLTWRQATPSQSQWSKRSQRKVRPHRDGAGSHPCRLPIGEKADSLRRSNFSRTFQCFSQSFRKNPKHTSLGYLDSLLITNQRIIFCCGRQPAVQQGWGFPSVRCCCKETNFPVPLASRWNHDTGSY